MKIESQKYIVTSTKITQNAVIFVSFHQDTPFPFSLLPVDDYLITLIFQIQSLPKKFNGKKMHVRNAARHMKSRVFFSVHCNLPHHPSLSSKYVFAKAYILFFPTYRMPWNTVSTFFLQASHKSIVLSRKMF